MRNKPANPENTMFQALSEAFRPLRFNSRLRAEANEDQAELAAEVVAVENKNRKKLKERKAYFKRVREGKLTEAERFRREANRARREACQRAVAEAREAWAMEYAE